jgi:DNA-binding NtrC family response regulator
MLRRLVRSAGHQVIEAGGGRQAVARMSEEVALVLLDPYMPDLSGIDVLRLIRKHFADVQVMMIAGTSRIGDAAAAIKEGAFDYFHKPWNQDQLRIRIGQALRLTQLARENRHLRQLVGFPLTSTKLVGRSRAIEEVAHQIATFARIDSTVLITGPPGTGKTTAAQMIHQHGPRSGKPFVAVNCKALPRNSIEVELFGHVRGAFDGAVSDRPGRAEIAYGGTLLLDEIGDLPLDLQPKLLRLLDQRTLQRLGSSTVKVVDLRVIATTGRDLGLMCRQGRFRNDLFCRLNVESLRMPPLSEHREDIAELASEILSRIARRRGTPPILSQPALETLYRYDWPGNVREMENVLERACAAGNGSTIHSGDLAIGQLRAVDRGSESAPERGFAGTTLAEIERRAIIDTLKACGGNRSKTARSLGVSEKTIYNKLKKYNLH